MKLHDKKEEILDHIQRIYLPYTVIDVGWWYQLTVLRVPSGKLDHGLGFPNNNIIAGGNTPSALLNILDVGKYVAAIIDDPRTINKKVLANTEAKTQNEVHELVDKVTDEKPERTELSKEQLEAQYLQFKGTNEISQTRSVIEYWMSWGVWGDNTAVNAVYLGYLLASVAIKRSTPRTLDHKGSAKNTEYHAFQSDKELAKLMCMSMRIIW
uniref:NmrA-like domain-containing protein n=1 Tax=Fusarium oxysporum (strain Fo5176) TaxID=660025 RepID=A0A0D2Y3L9_FUSOF